MHKLQMHKLWKSLRSLAVILALITVSGVLIAQTDTGRITGTVADATGAFIPDADDLERTAIFRRGGCFKWPTDKWLANLNRIGQRGAVPLE